MDLDIKLRDLGFSDKETSVYTALLQLGQATVQEIAKNSKVNRTTTYVILESLREKGLVSNVDKEGKTLFIANAPSSIKGFLDHQTQEVESKYRKLELLLPQLKSIHNLNSDKPVVKFFDGEKGLVQAAKEFYGGFEGNDEFVRLFYSQDNIKKNIDKKILDSFSKARESTNTSTRVIYNYSEGEREVKKWSNRIRVDENKFPISIDLEVYGDKVFISTLEENLSAVLIQNKQIANSLKSIFELAWIGAKKENNNLKTKTSKQPQ